MNIKYHKKEEKATGNFIEDELERLAREGARRMLIMALETEVKEFLGRDRYERSGKFRGYRNGYGKERQVAIGYGYVPVKPPRVSNVPPQVCPGGFESRILSRYQRSSRGVQANLARLYLEGLSSGDFEPVFRELLGESVALSPSSIIRLKEEWEREYEAWRHRDLSEEFYAYIWVDGIYLKAGLEREKTALLCVLGVREDGRKELLAMEEGYRESTASWAEVLRDLKRRGLAAPLLAIGDGALGIWTALRDVYPETREQRCWNHKMMNVLDKLPKWLHREVKKRLREIYQAESRSQCMEWAQLLARDLRLKGENRAAECLLRDFKQFVTFYDFPREHWVHIRTTNPLESIFAGVRIRTNVVRRFRKRESALWMVFKLVQRLSGNWKPIKGRRLLPYLKERTDFRDGLLLKEAA